MTRIFSCQTKFDTKLLENMTEMSTTGKAKGAGVVNFIFLSHFCSRLYCSRKSQIKNKLFG